MATGSAPRSSAARPRAALPAASFTGAALVRLLTRLAGPDAPTAEAPFAERLGQWLHWTDAATLSEVLDGVTAPTPPAPASTAPPDVEDLALALRRSRETMARSIEADVAAARDELDGTDFAPWRRLVVNRVQSVQAGLMPLRAKLRGALTAQAAPHAPPLARLAEMDAVMERALGAQERALLCTTLPSLLQRHAERLQQQVPSAWRAPFCNDLHAVLMAALDLCLQPLDGLLAALRSAAAATADAPTAPTAS